MSSTRVGPYEAEPVDGPPPFRWWTSTWSSGEPVLLRAFPSSTREALVEAAALCCADHPHVVEVLDVFHFDGRPVVVTRGVPSIRLDAWLAGRGTLARGEAVTLVVPLASALAHLAARGVVPAVLPPHCIGIDDRGAPVIIGLSSGDVAVSTAPPDALSGTLSTAAPAGHPGVVDLWSLVVDRLDDESCRGVPPTTPDELLEWAHDLGEPRPLPTVFLTPAVGAVGEQSTATLRTAPRETPAWLAVLPESALIDRALAWWHDRPRAPLRDRLRVVRPRFWVVVGVLVLSLVGASLLSPREDAATDADGLPRPSTSPLQADASGGPPPGMSPTISPSAEEAVLRGDDAAAATAVLLEARVECLRDPTPSCIAAVDHHGSPLARSDSALVDDPAATAQALLPTRLGPETQRLGESVLFEAHTADDEPASVLVVRTEAGWRLREIIARQ